MAVSSSTSTHIQLHSIEEAIADIQAGKMIIVVDDEDRENEGDFVCAAEKVSGEVINFMMKEGRGLICVPITEDRAQELELPLMVTKNTDLHETAFTVSLNVKGEGMGRGSSATARAATIQAIVNGEKRAADFEKPGHTLPLRAKNGGVLRRAGHTEAAVDLARMAGLYPAGVIVEVLNPDGTMARLPELVEIARKHEMKIISIEDLIAYRMQHERMVDQEVGVTLDTHFGPFEVIGFKDRLTGKAHIALKKGDWAEDEPVLTRVHAGSFTHEIMNYLAQGYDFPLAMKRIAKEGKGVLIFLQEESHPNNFLQVLQQISEQNPAEATPGEALFPPRDMIKRNWVVAAQIMRDLGIRKLRLLSNHEGKRVGLSGFGLEVVEYVRMKKKG
ncbi:MAG: 3,4-dihydroxy-2-butanone-4-phosphate synthase [Bacteroidota bacterium]